MKKKILNLMLVGMLCMIVGKATAQTKVRPTEKQLKKDREMYEHIRTRAGTEKTPSGILYSKIVKGNGPVPNRNSKVVLKYGLVSFDANVLDTRYLKEPWQGQLSSLMPGMQELLLMMPAGSKWQCCIPASKTTEKNGEQIGGGRMLNINMELLAVK